MKRICVLMNCPIRAVLDQCT